MIMKKRPIEVPEEVRRNIENLLRTRFYMFRDFALTENRDYSFFGHRSLLSPRELTYLSHLLEMQYNIRFCAGDYDNPMFYSVNGLSEIVLRLVNGKV